MEEIMTDSDKIQTLPLPFLERMKEMLGDDYDAFLKSYKNPRTYGLRVNTAKLSCQDFQALSPFPIRPIPWINTGYFYEEESRPARCPYYQAGLYYLQEPSAMTPASRLPIEPGDFVLDLCAAPGGKATALGAALNDTGFLLANDISTSRARALLRNLELFGMKNMLVTDEKPAKLAQRFPAFFNKILLDAPCSGEGMFRKEEALARDWTPEKSAELSDIQKDLVLKAADMLRPGGMLLYSTCTFSPCEDEEVVAYLLRQRPEAEIPAPQAQLMKMIVEGIMGGNLPWGLVFVGVFLAICLEILRIPVMPFAIGLYLPIYLNATIMIGGIVRGLLDRRKGVDEKTKTAQATDGTLYCAGMIAGEGLVGILLAIFAVVGISLDMSGVVNLGNIGGVVLMIIMILSLLKFSIWRKKKA